MSQVLFKHQPEAEYFFAEGCYILETFNSPADPDASIVRARVAPGVTTRWHRLRDTAERYVILSGTGEAGVGDETVLVGPGDVVLIPPMVDQRVRNTGDQDLVFLAVCTPRFNPDNYIAADR
ncbi:MAG: cupin domain-containing protein [Xanthomonadales bacterium]|nr:cupin domain-containing protein [Xanthomonadales bacterium]